MRRSAPQRLRVDENCAGAQARFDFFGQSSRPVLFAGK
jgi:hypothetical protein